MHGPLNVKFVITSIISSQKTWVSCLLLVRVPVILIFILDGLLQTADIFIIIIIIIIIIIVNSSLCNFRNYSKGSLCVQTYLFK
jgi:hypothetical protein